MYNRGKIYEKKIGALEFTHNDSLQQCLTCSRGKIYEKNFWA